MGNLEDSIEIVKAERVVNAKIADSPGEEKTSEQLKAEEAKKSAVKDELVEHETKPIKKSELEVLRVEPVKNPNEICPFCLEEKSARGMNRHIAAIHEIEGVSIEDLGRVERGEITPADLAWEKSDYEGSAMVRALSPEISKKYFSDWEDPEPSEINDKERDEIQEKIKDPEKEKPRPKVEGEIKDDPQENGAGGGIPSFLFLVLVGAGIAGTILLGIPKYKEKGEKLLAYLGTLGSKKSPDSKSPINFNPPFGGGGLNRRF